MSGAVVVRFSLLIDDDLPPPITCSVIYEVLSKTWSPYFPQCLPPGKEFLDFLVMPSISLFTRFTSPESWASLFYLLSLPCSLS